MMLSLHLKGCKTSFDPCHRLFGDKESGAYEKLGVFLILERSSNFQFYSLSTPVTFELLL